MKVAFVHYHLKPGGVTTVIRQQAAALENDCDLLVLSGDPSPPDLNIPHIHIPGLSYDDPPRHAPDSRQTADAIESAIRSRWPQGCDLIHVHNPLLAKNRQLLCVLDLLKQRGKTLFLQVHDFAEDGRPWSYYGDQDYPADCHYGVINSRDYHLLHSSGLSEAGLHLLPNMVDPIGSGGGNAGTDTPVPATVLYPVRAIRRKNIGEALLLSLFFANGRPLAVTLPPNSPRDWKIYKEWKTFAAEHRMNAIFEASHAYGFKALVQSATCLLTTSISEGFGFAFLEPWTAGKALVGRKLPTAFRDFEQNGIVLNHLYDALNIPMGWIDGPGFITKWRGGLRQTAECYRFRIDPGEIDKGIRELTRNETLDFALLDEPLQRQVIGRLIRDPSACDALKRLNPVLSEMADPRVSQRQIDANRRAVLREYGREAYRRRLLETYERVKTVPVEHRIRKERLLGQLLDPKHFGLLKWYTDEL